MKMNRIVLPLVLALAATLATTGCKKGQPKTTMIPGQQGGMVSDPNAGTMPSNPTYNPGETPGSGPGSNPLADRSGFDNMIQDRVALAAETIHFSFDSAVIKKSENLKIESVAQALKSNPSDKLQIEGNCDERGTKEYNMSLGERRALAAREALGKAGVDQSRIITKSFGKDNPADTAHNEAAWSKNRRDDFVLLHPKM